MMQSPETFADIEGRESFLDSPKAKILLDSLPLNIRQKLVDFYLGQASTEIAEMSDVMEYFTANSEIFSLFRKNSGNALAFEYLYHRQVSGPIDRYFIDCKAGFQIYRRLCSLEENLPEWIRLVSGDNGKVKVDNIGSGTGRDMIRVLEVNPDLRGKISVRNIDPDSAALDAGRKIAEQAGVSESFSNIDQKFADAESVAADLVLLIGVLCPLHKRVSRTLLRNLGRFVRPGGIVIYSAALDTMLREDPFTDSIMRFCGVNMSYKTEDECSDLAISNGWEILGRFYDEPRRYHLMTVAQLPYQISRMPNFS